jgi:phosphatidylinositol alpha-1,6-mannosyltransferase
MTVAGLFPSLAPSQVGGIQSAGRTAQEVLVAYANAQDKSIRLVFYGEGESFVEGASCTSHRSKLSVARAALSLPRSTDFVFLWHLGFLRTVPLIRTPKATIVCYLHGVDAWRRIEHRIRPVARSRRFRLLTVAHSHYSWERFVEANPTCASLAHRVVELGVGRPLQGVTPTPQEPPALLMLGRMTLGEDYKGHREIVNAWPRVLKEKPQAQLWIAGDGDLRPELHRLVRLHNLESSVHIFGLVTEKDKESLLSRCRALAMPSRGEGFGLVYLEAMRMGRPCLVSTMDAGREVIGETGLSVDPSNTHELTQSLCRLLQHGDEWEAWSRAARFRYESRFTEAHFRVRLARLLKEAVTQTDHEQDAPG